MKVTVTTLADQIFNLEISEDLELENFKAFCEVESGVPSSEILIVHNGRPLTEDKKSLKDLGLTDGDIVILQQHHRQSTASIPNSNPQFGFGMPQSRNAPPPPSAATGAAAAPGVPQFDFSSIQVPGRPVSAGRSQSQNNHSRQSYPNLEDPTVLRDILLNDPEQLAILEQNNPSLADALKKGDFGKKLSQVKKKISWAEEHDVYNGDVRYPILTKQKVAKSPNKSSDKSKKQTFSRLIRDLQKQRQERDKLRVRLLAADAFDAEAQRLIADEIRQKNIDANMEAAMEFNPESFGTVVMLYINCKVNGHPVKAFIDSGAQTTIMSTECAERCNIMRLVDTRFSGIAKGVGTQKIIGRIHMVQIQIDKDFLTTSFSILEDQKMDMLLGLDMLRRHQCVIDLKRGILNIGTTNTETPFLPESELPELARLTTSQSTLAEERALSDLGGEDAGLARALEDSIRDSISSAGPATPNSSSSRTDINLSQPAGAGVRLDEAVVHEITKLGFARDKVIFELRRFNGDKTQAIAALFAKSLNFKPS